MRAALETYRFFAVDCADHVLWDCCRQCEDDADAQEMATDLAAGGPLIEVWDVGRFIFKISSSQMR